ncbi:prenyltransferase/squalene oxidase repeat-containing protein [Thermomonospora umbrina]|uniref:Prenyltransferase/squalene oxidase-like repeat protein n=1 Tax=Thermomonospora umbrina TaxID=111806 RepID=A0A3D9SKA7_9ACTN|nr:prenyltransferase/squalene oxidase repeat-containing protein [Thermomonospora umbrina]REE94830.1 prenyltransferase/squalene oxidase-like repeat protein [Thermomonospora umbrina]
MTPDRTPVQGRSQGGAGRRTAHVDLLLMDAAGEHLAVHDERGRLTCPRLTIEGLPEGVRHRHDELGALVRRLAEGQLGLDVAYRGLLAAEESGDTVGLVVTAVLRAVPDGSRLRLLPVADVRSRHRDLQHRDHFEAARHWHEAVRHAPELGRRIERSLRTAASFLTRRRAEEDGHWGWEQYLEADSIGTLSTAIGVLTCLHAGEAGEFTDQALQTLRVLQNTDGGWQIRRSLVGADSDASITESTCACLWAFHEAGRRPTTEESVRRALAWLEERQRGDGGWPSAADDRRSLVYPTALAVRVLALYGRSGPVARGVQWLRAAQCPDGGWGATAPAGDDTVSSSPAYAATALLALRAADVPASEHVIIAGCEYLLDAFAPERPEPWEPTSFTSLVDAGRFARMDFRHFATPWALAALCECGYDLGHPVVLTATVQLLRLERPGGGWRSTLTAPDITPIWAVHGAVYALRTVLATGTRDLAPLVLGRHHDAERRTLSLLAGGLIGHHAEPVRPPHVWRRRLLTVWAALLTVAVALLVLGQFGVLEQLQSDSGRDKVLAGLTTLVVTVVGALAPAVISEEYRIRRSRGRAGSDRESLE